MDGDDPVVRVPESVELPDGTKKHCGPPAPVAVTRNVTGMSSVPGGMIGLPARLNVPIIVPWGAIVTVTEHPKPEGPTGKGPSGGIDSTTPTRLRATAEGQGRGDVQRKRPPKVGVGCRHHRHASQRADDRWFNFYLWELRILRSDALSEFVFFLVDRVGEPLDLRDQLSLRRGPNPRLARIFRLQRVQLVLRPEDFVAQFRDFLADRLTGIGHGVGPLRLAADT
jgi:hypothetical protein